ncbi:MAG: DUF6320 domain-containing protein [Lachnospiraceae bacterium]
MRNCPKCNITVGGIWEYCPICQNQLNIDEDNEIVLEATDDDKKNISEQKTDSEADVPYFPGITALKVKSIAYKIQLFIALTICVVCLSIDLLFNANGKIHWSYIVVMWIVGFEIVIGPILKKRSIPANFITNVAILFSCIFAITSYFIGDIRICTHIQLPIVVLITLVINFVLSLVDKKGNALVFALGNVLVGIIPNIVLLIIYHSAPVLWRVCFVVSVVFLIGLIIFKGRQVNNEIQKRLNI